MDVDPPLPGPDTKAAEHFIRRALHAERALPGTRMGPYRILDMIGGGGMGVVYRAELDEGPAPVKVALKVIRPGVLDDTARRRFEFEAQALAAMDHDAIAKVHGAGTTDDGDPWLAMELVEGLELTRFCDERQMPIPDRIRLFEQVCLAVDHAHRRLVIHRDLKPGNVLVVDRDGVPTPKIIDFGIARAVEREASSGLLITEDGRIGGTREYMSPEQALGKSATIDTRTDIYSLGVTLYELISGALPFESQRLRALAWPDVERVLREVDPPPPSKRVATGGAEATTSASARDTRPDQLARELQGELDWIVFKAMAKDPGQRYGSAAELAADLRRHLQNEPIVAGPARFGYRLRKFVRRHRVAVIAGVAIVFSLIALTVAEIRRREVAKRDAAMRALEAALLFEELRERERGLCPPWPSQLPQIEDWLAEASDLVVRRPAFVTVRDEFNAIGGRETARVAKSLGEFMGKLDVLESSIERVSTTTRRWAQHLGSVDPRDLGAPSWEAAALALRSADGIAASTAYAAHPIDLAPQEGMVPLGKNPATGLWEFYDLRSAWDPARPDALPTTVPKHRLDGTLDFGSGSGIVWVLVPGGTFEMGSQAKDAAQPNYDPDRSGSEHRRRVAIAPFFLARHELTQAQWMRLGAPNPSYFVAEPNASAKDREYALASPVDTPTWTACNELLRRHGLSLPTEAQWEYACRAGTTWPRWNGPSLDSLLSAKPAINLKDKTARRIAQAVEVRTYDDAWQEYDDGFAGPAPAQCLRPNPWGFYHILGNVWEWCLDEYDQAVDATIVPRSGDGLLEISRHTGERIRRGGGFDSLPGEVRASRRHNMPELGPYANTGLRPARRLIPR